ncbi:MAG TPA: RNA polymerase factor sigma-54 [Gammaproteobacteria bacterium]|nr:RNA polymerase factor sigma-54 [Gammaproteobacteria bacterium]
MLKTGLQLRMGQSLALTPQLQQTIKLLQYSALELQNQVQEMIEQNPLLEIDETDRSPVEAPSEPAVSTDQDSPVSLDQQDVIPTELPVDTDWESIYTGMPAPRSTAGDTDISDMLENLGELETSLRDHLQAQLELTNLSDLDRVIGTAIIDAIKEDGYLGESLKDLHSCLVDELENQLDNPLELDELEAVRKHILQFEPIGCGSLDLRENLLLQIKELDKTRPKVAHAKLILERYFPELEKQNLKRLTSRSRLTTDEVEDALDLIRSLKPRPGSAVGGKAADYVKPDVFVMQRGDAWVASLNAEVSPQLRIHPYYSSLVKRGDKSEQNQYIRDQLQEARWFLKSIQSRNDTILKVANVIVEKQQAFFEQGEEAMRPMILRDVAEIVEMHESTISRVTNSKYMLTPRGVLSFKYFFSSQLGTSDGGNTSATAIRAVIRNLIAEENNQKPLSDSKITTMLLSKNGIKVARRTVAKYREAMQIPPSNERKRIA